jgi:small subunit ribosomal protein S2
LKALKPKVVFRPKQSQLSLKQLLKVNLHIGEHKSQWNQNNLQYLYGHRNDIHIINLEHTLVALRRAMGVCFEVAKQGGNIVFVGTKPKLHKLVVETSIQNNCFYIIHWMGGMLTNKERVLRRSVGYDPDKVSNTQEDGEFIHEQPYVHTPDLLILLDYPNTKWFNSIYVGLSMKLI